jgi:hypothetical protein
MATYPETRAPRRFSWLSAILLLLLLLFVYLWFTARAELSRATSQFTGDVSMYSKELIKECTLTPTSTPAQREECENAFEGFGETFGAYGKQLVSLTATTSDEIAPYVTTPSTTVQSGTSATTGVTTGGY